jgi:hypothetical protein
VAIGDWGLRATGEIEEQRERGVLAKVGLGLLLSLDAN